MATSGIQEAAQLVRETHWNANLALPTVVPGSAIEADALQRIDEQRESDRDEFSRDESRPWSSNHRRGRKAWAGRPRA